MSSASCPFLAFWAKLSYTSCGITNASCSSQPRLSRKAFTFSSPNGEPCEDSLPSLAGQPNAILVFTVINDGFVFSDLASSIALLISSKLLPSSTVKVWK